MQAWYHASCLRLVYGVSDFLVISRRRDRAERLAERLGSGVRVAGSLEELLMESRLVVAATTAESPVVLGRFLQPGSWLVLRGG